MFIQYIKLNVAYQHCVAVSVLYCVIILFQKETGLFNRNL